MNKILTLFLFFFSFTVVAQEKVYSGKVTGADGVGLTGAIVELLGTGRGTTTDFDGAWSIVADTGVIRISYTGFASQDIELSDQLTINIVLLEAPEFLEEVVVIGYGVQKKKDLTTAVVTVDQEAIKDRPIVSPAEALQGKAAGVQVVQYSGKPGSDVSVRVRGSTSVLAGNEPLYVVDGVPTTDIRGLNPNDVASMTVLKDASSAAIYGARAANGVVLITTKRGVGETPVVSFNMYAGVSKLREPIEVLNTKKYRELIEEIMPGSLDPAATDFNDWNEFVFGTGINQSYQLSFSGGTEKSKYYVSGAYLNEQGIVEPARFDRYSIRLNLDNELTSWLNIATSFNILHSDTKDTPDNASSGRGGVIMSTLNTPPFLNVYKKDGSGQYDPNPFQPSWENPAAYMFGADQLAIDDRLFGNLVAGVKILEGLQFKSNLGIDINNHRWDYYLDPYRTNFGRQQNGIGRSDKSNTTSLLWENTLSYLKSFDNHNFTFLVGNSIQRSKWNDSYIEGNDYPGDTNVTTLNAANSIRASTDIQEWSLASFFGRVTYDLANKYYLTASVRRDGSSKLAEPWGTMPSFSAGWRISAESFMDGVTFIDDLKLRGGWGQNGNQEGIPNYAQYGLVNYYRRPPTNPLSGPSAVQVTYGNPDLRWETTAQSNIGFDVAMFNYRVNVNFDAYIKKTSDVLLNVQLSNSLPITTIQTNAGDIENRGIEFNISTINIDKTVRWNSDLNMSFNKNEVTALEYTDVYYFGRIYSNNQDVSILKVGLPLGSFFGYVSEGVDPETGDIKYKDVNNNGIFDTGDRTVIGNAQPDFVWGFTNTVGWKRFDLNVFFQGSQGNDIYNATRIDLEGMFDSKNQSVDVLRRWTPENTNTDIPRAVGGGNVDNVRNSTRFVEDGSYVRLKSVTLSYALLQDNPKLNAIRNLSIYVTGQNLLTFTNYRGLDPEVNAFGNSATELGIDYGTYPQARTLIFGVNVDF
ncbi:MAG TPA: TonB-dependent receptor [Saprospiraceae bacterium]